MIFRQLYDRPSSTYSYLLAGRPGGEALLIDPVQENTALYASLADELELRLVLTVDTHMHADHVTGLGSLKKRTGCATAMGDMTEADCLDVRFADGERLHLDGLDLFAIYTPGHTDDSYSLLLADRVFTGDTLLIRGTGRTDFQNGDAAAQYESLFGTLLTLPDSTLVYPAHDYRGMTVSSIGEEKRFNPRLQVADKAAYVAMMNALELDDPELMDVALPANRNCGLRTAA